MSIIDNIRDFFDFPKKETVNEPTVPKKETIERREIQMNSSSEKTPYSTNKTITEANRKKETSSGTSTAKLTIVEPRVYSEAMKIAKMILQNEGVIVNFRLIEEDQARRIVDFLTGTVYALKGDIQQISTGVFLCTPENITIDGVTAKSMLQENFKEI